MVAPSRTTAAATTTRTKAARAESTRATIARTSSPPARKKAPSRSRTAVVSRAKPQGASDAVRAKPRGKTVDTRATLTLSSKNYSSWSLRGWLLCRFAGLEVDEVMVSPDDAEMRRELLLLAPSILVPCLTHEGTTSWNVMAIAYYLDEVYPQAGLLPDDRALRAHCRSICGEMNSGFANLRSALPMNLKARHEHFKIWAGAQPDIARVVTIWRECLARCGGPYLFGRQRTMADAMYAPVVTRFLTYAVPLDATCSAYCKTIMSMPEMKAWIAAAKLEADEIEELDMEF